MSTAGVVLAPGVPLRPRGGRAGVPGPVRQAAGALEASLDEVVVVLGSAQQAAGLPEAATVLLDGAREPGEVSALRVAVDWCARAGHEQLVLALPGARTAEPAAWRALAAATGRPVLVGRDRRGPLGLVRLEAVAWGLLPLEGRIEVLWAARPELAGEVLVEAAELR